MTRYEKVLRGAAFWGAYYRYNPDKCAKDYLHLNLKRFQKFSLVMMFWVNIFVWIAARGLGKTFLSAIYCAIRCILYPGTKICIASGTRGQAILVLEKIIQELVPRSEELRAEIDWKETKVNNTVGQIVFKNTSVIKVVTASDSSRGNRCNVLLLDEFRLISKDVIDTILRKFLTYRRLPDYVKLTDEERKAEYNKEKNLTVYLSSAYFKDHWAYTKCEDTYAAMISGKRKQFICGFPYQLALEEGLLDPDSVIDDMAESDFSEIKFGMEMEAMFYGSAEDAFFDFDSISKNRNIKYPLLPDNLSSKLPSPLVRIPPKQNGEIRILSADIALMSSKKHKNDAASIFINRLIPTKAGRYSSNIVYPDVDEGLRTDAQALKIRKLFDEYSCDYLVIDASGIGLGCYDALAGDIVDSNTGEIYPALSCCNNPEMAARCTVPGAKKVIWAIKANAQFNSDCAFLLREGFRSGRIRLLLNEYDAEEALSALKGYSSLSPTDKLKFRLPYIHTTLLIDELVNLEHEEAGGKIRISEKSGMRKDRYSSLSYNYYVAIQLENKLNKKNKSSSSGKDMFIIKPPAYKGKAVSAFGYGGNRF
jgi:Phage Terminase.